MSFVIRNFNSSSKPKNDSEPLPIIPQASKDRFMYLTWSYFDLSDLEFSDLRVWFLYLFLVHPSFLAMLDSKPIVSSTTNIFLPVQSDKQVGLHFFTGDNAC